MNEQEAIKKMVAPGTRRPGKYREGVIQIWLTRACDKACFGCTQGSNLKGYSPVITTEQFEQACLSLKDYFGVVGIFGGNPVLHPKFNELCEILRTHIPYERRGLWCNRLFGKGKTCRETFNPAVSNINVHCDQIAYDEIKKDWPEANVFGLKTDSRHSPPYVAMKDVIDDEGKRWELISNCDINQHWSAMIGVFREQLRAWFCEIAGAQSILQQNNPEYPDTGIEVTLGWWKLSMQSFTEQVKKHCHECGVPLRIYGSLSQDSNGEEITSVMYLPIYKPKDVKRPVHTVCSAEGKRVSSFIDYLGNARR